MIGVARVVVPVVTETQDVARWNMSLFGFWVTVTVEVVVTVLTAVIVAVSIVVVPATVTVVVLDWEVSNEQTRLEPSTTYLVVGVTVAKTEVVQTPS